jgi:GT2 family glycosyltransferase
MSKDLPAVDVVVPVHDQLDLTRGFLDSLTTFTRYPFRLILVDNGSAQLPESFVGGFANALLIRCPANLGFAGGCNAGLRAGRHPLAAVVNNDLILTQGWLDRLARKLLEDPTIAAAAPSTNYAAGDQVVDIGPFDDEEGMHRRAGAFTARYPGMVEDVACATGMCFLVRRDVLDETGLFDERYGAGNFEDNDLCLRIKNLGLRIVVARDVFVFHYGNRTFQALGIDYRMQMDRNQTLYLEKWKSDHWIQGTRLERRGDLFEALKCYLSSLKEGCRNPEPLLRIGIILLTFGRYEAAAQAFQQYLLACPESHPGLAGLGQALCASGNVPEGLELLRDMLLRRYLSGRDREKIEKWIGNFSSSPCRQPAEVHGSGKIPERIGVQNHARK